MGRETITEPIKTDSNPQSVGLDLNALAATDLLKKNTLMTDQPKKPRGRPKGAASVDVGTPSLSPSQAPQPAPIVKRSYKLLIEKLYSCAERSMKRRYGAEYSEPKKEELESLVKDTDDAFSELLFGLGISVNGWVTSLIVLMFLVGAYCYEKYLIILELNDKIRSRKVKPDISGTSSEQ